MTLKVFAASLFALTLMVSAGHCQNRRDLAVREDKQELSSDSFWIYDDLDAALSEASAKNKPVMVVFR